MRRKPIQLSLIALLLLTLLALVIWVPPRLRHYWFARQTQPIQAALESYRQQHGFYPESLSEAAIPEQDELYYQRKIDGSYVLWYGTTLGESVTLSSTDHKWRGL